MADAPFYRPEPDSAETKYLLERRKALGGFLPQRRVTAKPLNIPTLADFAEFTKGSGQLKVATTMAFVRLMTSLLKNKEIGPRVVPIIPDEARTFGMDALFREFGIYSSKGQLYEPVDAESLLYYNEQKDGQLIEEGINEAGSMSTFIAAGSSYATHGQHMIPFYIYYSMFGFQRVGDLIWAAADTKVKGFLLGATSGRTTLNGEGLQHEDGHSLIMASTVPTLMAYDPAFAYEIAVIVQDGMKRMYQNGEDLFYYMTLYNETHLMPPMPAGAEAGILAGLYKFKKAEGHGKLKAHIFGSGPIINEAIRAQAILEKYDVSADVWSATSYNRLRREAIEADRWNRLHPASEPRKSYVRQLLEKEQGIFVAVSDNMKIVAEQIAPWVPGGLTALGTDGFGRSDTRPNLRRFFEIDAEMTAIAVLSALADKGQVKRETVAKAIQDLGVDPDKTHPSYTI